MRFPTGRTETPLWWFGALSYAIYLLTPGAAEVAVGASLAAPEAEGQFHLAGGMASAMSGCSRCRSRNHDMHEMVGLSFTPKTECKTRHAGGEASAWSEWLQPLLQQAVQVAPLEFSSLWACCVRFAVHSLSESGSDALGSLLDSISTPIYNGELSHLPNYGVQPTAKYLTDLV